jgi:L-threonylcarbamoyladenylate synthase
MNAEVNRALEIVQNGGTLLYPTDTIWGLGCDATNADAVRKIYALKQRDDSKSLIILLAEPKDILQYVAAPPPDIVDMIRQFDRPTTVIYPQAIGLPDNLVHSDGTIAIRVTRDPFCKTLIKRLRRPLVSTSANISGAAAPTGFSDIAPEIKSGVDYIVNHRRMEQTDGRSSRIIRISNEGAITVIRP